jgi:hypothetical protein
MNPQSATPLQLLPYLVFLLVYVVLCLTSELTRRRFFHLSALGVALLFAGFRNTISPDMERYRYFYEHYQNDDYQKLIEPSFVLVSTVLNKLDLNYHSIFFFYTLISLCFVSAAIKNLTGHVKTSMLLYILIPHLFLNLFIEMRQECAVSVVFYAISLFRHKQIRLKKTRILILALISIAVHYSAAGYWIIYLIFSWWIKRQHSLKLYSVSLFVSLIIPSWAILSVAYFALYPVLPPEYQLHVDELRGLSTGSGEHSLASLAIYNSLALAFVVAERTKSIPKSFADLVNIFFIGVIFLNLTRAYGDMARFADYFIIYEIILLPVLLFRAGKPYLRPAMIYGVLLFYFVHFIDGLYYLNEETGTYIFLNYSNALLPDSKHL